MFPVLLYNNMRRVDMKQTVHVIGKPCVELNTDDLAFSSSFITIHPTRGPTAEHLAPAGK